MLLGGSGEKSNRSSKLTVPRSMLCLKCQCHSREDDSVFLGTLAIVTAGSVCSWCQSAVRCQHSDSSLLSPMFGLKKYSHNCVSTHSGLATAAGLCVIKCTTPPAGLRPLIGPEPGYCPLIGQRRAGAASAAARPTFVTCRTFRRKSYFLVITTYHLSNEMSKKYVLFH